MKIREFLNFSLTFILFINTTKTNCEYEKNQTICKQIYSPLRIGCMYEDGSNQNTFYLRNGTDNPIKTNSSAYTLHTFDKILYNTLRIENLTKNDQGIERYHATKNGIIECNYNIYLYSKSLKLEL